MHESDSSSMVVEIDSPKDPLSFVIFEDPPFVQEKRRARGALHQGRPRELFHGGIASRQKLRKKNRQRAPSQISANIVKSTGQMLGKTVTGTVEKARDAFGIVRESTGHLSKMVKKWKHRKEDLENIDLADLAGKRHEGYSKDVLREYGRARDVLREFPGTGDELHKYLYDLHGADLEVQSSTDDNGVSSVGYVVPMDNGWARRRQSWTNLSSVLLDKEKSVAVRLSEEEEQENLGLPVIEEDVEVSQCGISPMTPRKRDCSRMSVRDVLWEDELDQGQQKPKWVELGNAALKKVEEYLQGLEISPSTNAPLVPLPSQATAYLHGTQKPSSSTPTPSTHLPLPQAAPLPSHPSDTTFKPTDPLPSTNWETFSTASPSAPPPGEPKSHILPFPETTQDLFNINSTTYYTINEEDQEPVKLPPHQSTMDAEITRSSSILEHYMTADTGTITFPDNRRPMAGKKTIGGGVRSDCVSGDDAQRVTSAGDSIQRLVSGESQKVPSSSSYSDILGGQEHFRNDPPQRHTSEFSTLGSAASPSLDDPPFQRQVSSIYSRSQNSRQVSHINPPFAPPCGRSDSPPEVLLSQDADECITLPTEVHGPEKPLDEDLVDTSIPAVNAFKWAPVVSHSVSPSSKITVAAQELAPEPSQELFGAGKSVRDRVRELDLAIDSTAGMMKFDHDGTGIKRKRSLFGIGRWRDRF